MFTNDQGDEWFLLIILAVSIILILKLSMEEAGWEGQSLDGFYRSFHLGLTFPSDFKDRVSIGTVIIDYGTFAF